MDPRQTLEPSASGGAHPGRDSYRHGGGGNYISLPLWSSVRSWRGSAGRRKLSRRGRGSLQAANLAGRIVPEMEIVVSTLLPVVLPPEAKARKISVRIVRDLPYAFILGAKFFRCHSSIISLRERKGFQPSPEVPWVSYQPRSAATTQSWDRYCAIQRADDFFTPASAPPLGPPLPVCSVGQAAWDDDGTLQWELRLTRRVEVAGFVGKTVEGYVKGPQLSERQLVLIQSLEKYDTDCRVVVGMARAVPW